ncbi:MAG: 16S rRNA (cytosine(1402)-N(4))-methyltransferase RsmH [Deltaproteobacteria bacterium]|jgi:16S rRNA (cytosine1402-N4)-methyltransferase|nr:16S rRNA (cytosine(1402)-N(4))-methyltransferase RsmH [Deltaproteobacteria bacterium]
MSEEKSLTSNAGAPDNGAAIHISVMLEEVLEHLVPASLLESAPADRPLRFLDGTLGLAGHAAAVLDKVAQYEGNAPVGSPGQTGKGERKAELLGLDHDAQAQDLARLRLDRFGDAAHFWQGGFADCTEALDELGWDFIDGALVDLGVSSLQLDEPERGFSFLRDGPLDMRMDPHGGQESAATLVNRATVQRLKEIIEVYGEEPQAGRIARAIDEARARKPIENTLELAAIVERAYPPKWRATARNHPATRTFQALRLVVNEELEQLRLFLERIVPRLRPGGRLAVISFHSLEDRIVKHFFRAEATDCLCPPRLPRCVCGHRATLGLVNKKPLEPSEEETRANPRARSAKLRVAERTSAEFVSPAQADSGSAPVSRRGARPSRGK